MGVGGYDIDEIYVLEWENRPGAYVKARSVSTGEMLAISAKIASDGAPDDRGRATRDNMLTLAAEVLAQVVVEWNFERRGVPVPITVDGALMLGHKLLLDVYGAYMNETTSGIEVPPSSPLDDGSLSGLTYPEELMMMETSSSNPLSSDTPTPS